MRGWTNLRGNRSDLRRRILIPAEPYPDCGEIGRSKMAYTPTTNSRAATSAPPAFPQSAIRTALIAAFAVVCVFWLCFLSSAAVRHDSANSGIHEPLSVTLLEIGFLLGPYAVCLLLVSARRHEFVAAGAGIACGLFGAFLLVSPYALTVMSLFVGLSAWNSAPDLGLVAAGLALLSLVGISIWIVWLGFRVRKIEPNAFLKTICATGLYIYFGFHSLNLVAVKGHMQAQRQKEQADMNIAMPAMLARQKIISLTACLIQNHMQNREQGYPVSLDSPPAGWGCDTKFTADMVPEFTLFYSAQTDAASGVAVNFQLTAVPKEKGVRGREPLLSDNRGVVFVYYPWEMENVLPKIMVMTSDRTYSQIEALKNNIERYVIDKSNGVAPATLTAESIGGLGYEMPTIEDSGKRLETRNFEMLYFAPQAGDPGRFAVSSKCKSYGQNCVRSFFADFDGSIHATGEPRQATADDPPPIKCENGFSECEDVNWPVP
jgi:hypothetical protein